VARTGRLSRKRASAGILPQDRPRRAWVGARTALRLGHDGTLANAPASAYFGARLRIHALDPRDIR